MLRGFRSYEKESAISTIKHSDGRTEMIKTDLLIACDGANSIIREKCGKLALVIKGKAKSSLLDSYQTERYPIVRDIIEQNEHFTKMASFDKNFLTKLQKFGRELSQDDNGELALEIGNKLTQLDIHYKDSPIIKHRKLKPPKPGEQAPDVFIDYTSLYKYFSNTLHNTLLFTGTDSNEKQLEKLRQLQKDLEKEHSDLIKYIVSKTKLADSTNTIEDVNGIIHNSSNIKKPAIYIIRPDTYIAYYSEDLNLESIVKFFKHIYISDFALGS